MKKLTLAIVFAVMATAFAGCTVMLDTQSLTVPCTTDADCEEGFYCASTCLPGKRDASTAPDTAMPDTFVDDASAPDTFTPEDASAPDIFTPEDASAPDTFTPVDASAPDTFVEDAATQEDAATPEDAGSEDTV